MNNIWQGLVEQNENQVLTLTLAQRNAIADANAYIEWLESQIKPYRDALTLLHWAADCWQGGELRGDFDDCVAAIHAFLREA